jgi:hypothetical protein
METKNKLVVVLIASILLLAPFALANDTMNAEIDIIVPEPVVSVQVPESVFLGNMTWGYGSPKTGNVKVDINNTGNVDVLVTPVLAEPDTIFDYLWMTKRLSGPSQNWAVIGEWSMDIAKPTTLGGVRKDYFYTKLDLAEFEGELNESMIGHHADILFIAVAQ